MGNTANTGIDGSATRRVLYTRLAAHASQTDVRRAERLLLRGIKRQWPEAQTGRLLQRLLSRALPQGPAERMP